MINEINVLDKGFIKLIDTMGTDSSIVQAARVSYGQGNKTLEEDTKLIKYLMKHEHMSPFEMCVLKFHVKAPIFVARQWCRHRNGAFNEISGRYAEVKPEFYVPIEFRKQDTKNKQGSSKETVQYIIESYDIAYTEYRKMIDIGVSREMARIVLPLATYTEFYWKVDLRNLFHFLELRLDTHAQYEIRVYAEAIKDIIKEKFPIAYNAFEEYTLNKK